jgi:3-phosphoshikimate 1-carboxyvinyltransferase
MPDITLTPPSAPFRATIAPPGSKSLTNRALILASMADGTSTLRNVLFADDTQVMLDALAKLGYAVEVDRPAHVVTLRGGPVAERSAELYCQNSGTTLRFLAAALCRARGTYRLDGNERMRQRPIEGLATLLKHLGVRVTFDGQPGYPPLTVHADGLPGGLLTFGASASSQYLSAVLMVAPFARHEVQVKLEGPQMSWPYVAMTMRLMDTFGHLPELERDPDTGDPKRIVIPIGTYSPTDYTIEPDASNASYLLAAAALHPGSAVTIQNLGTASLQGDIAIADYLAQMGANVTKTKSSLTVEGTEKLNGIDVDLTPTPDLAQTLAVAAIFATSSTTLRGLKSLRVKETDRVAALQNELTKLGAHIEVENAPSGEVSMTITPPRPPHHLRSADIETYDDHRMAMSFALAATKIECTTILNAECCSKTYPEFFEDFQRLISNEVS